MIKELGDSSNLLTRGNKGQYLAKRASRIELRPPAPTHAKMTVKRF